MQEKHIKLLSSSSYLPGEPVPFGEINNYLGHLTGAPLSIQKWMDKTQDLMQEMLEIEHSYYAFNTKTRQFDDDNLSLSVKAAKLAMEQAGVCAEDIDLLVYGGPYSHQMPPISTRIQEALGIEICGEFHIHSNCTSMYKAILVAHDLLRVGRYKTALVVSSNISSAAFIPEFYNQEKLKKEDIFLRWYLCDGAGALIFRTEDKPSNGFFLENTYVESAGGKKPSAMKTNYPYHYSNPRDLYAEGGHHIKQLFQKELMMHAFDDNRKILFCNGLQRMIEAEKIDLAKLKYLVVNMPTKSVRDLIADQCVELGIAKDKVYSAVKNIGYTGPPAGIISMDELLKSNTFNDQDLIFSFVMEVSKFMNAGFTIRYINK